MVGRPLRQSSIESCCARQQTGRNRITSCRLTPGIELVCARTVSCGARRAGHCGAETADLAPVMLPEHRDLRQMEVREPVSVLRWKAGLRWHRLSFGVASEIRQAALRKCAQSEKYEHPKGVKH
jgi:hypothetical protein